MAANNNVLGELRGGLASAVPGLAHAMTLGLVVFAALGLEHTEIAMRAGFAAAVFGGAAAALAAGTPIPATGPRASVSLILAGLVLVLARDPALAIADVVALACGCVVLAGLLQIALGLLHLGTIARFVPHPVVAGFMCGVAVLIVVNQLPALGFDYRLAGHEGTAQVRFLPLAVGAATAIGILVLAARRPRWPAQLLGLMIGVAIHYALASVLGSEVVGAVVGELPALLVLHDSPAAYAEALFAAHTRPHLRLLIATAVVIALIGGLDSLLAAVAVDAVAGTRHSANRELVAQGIGNVVSGICGGIPVALSPTRAIPAYRAGGRTRAVGVIAAALIALVGWIAVPLLEPLPLAVLAGVNVAIAWALVDDWTRSLVRRLAAGGREPALYWSASTALLVAAATVFVNFVVAVIAGLFLSIGWFIQALNRSLVRAVYAANVKPSRRIYGAELAGRLHAARAQIQVMELEGALFFGSTERLIDQVETLARAARFVVLDLSRLSAIDATGALALEQVARRASGYGASILLAGHVTQRAALLATGSLRHVEHMPWFLDADHAIEHAERALLGPIQPAEETPLEQLALADGLDEAEIGALRGALERLEMRAGDVLFREGDAGDVLYLLARGAVTIAVEAPEGAERRIVTFAPGAMFGEAALLDGRARSATAQVIEDAVLYAMPRRNLERLAEGSPATAFKLLASLGRQLSLRLRHTTEALRDLWDVRR